MVLAVVEKVRLYAVSVFRPLIVNRALFQIFLAFFVFLLNHEQFFIVLRLKFVIFIAIVLDPIIKCSKFIVPFTSVLLFILPLVLSLDFIFFLLRVIFIFITFKINSDYALSYD